MNTTLLNHSQTDKVICKHCGKEKKPYRQGRKECGRCRYILYDKIKRDQKRKAKRYYWKNREKILEKNRKWHRANKEKNKNAKQRYNKEYYSKPEIKQKRKDYMREYMRKKRKSIVRVNGDLKIYADSKFILNP